MVGTAKFQCQESWILKYMVIPSINGKKKRISYSLLALGSYLCDRASLMGNKKPSIRGLHPGTKLLRPGKSISQGARTASHQHCPGEGGYKTQGAASPWPFGQQQLLMVPRANPTVPGRSSRSMRGAEPARPGAPRSTQKHPSRRRC